MPRDYNQPSPGSEWNRFSKRVYKDCFGFTGFPASTQLKLTPREEKSRAELLPSFVIELSAADPFLICCLFQDKMPMVYRICLTLVVLVGWGTCSQAQSQSPPQPNRKPADALATSLRNLILQFIPMPLHEDDKHWGKQIEVDRIEWKGKGLKVHPVSVKVKKNHGTWWKVVIMTPMIKEGLICEVHDLAQPEPGRMTFALYLAFDTLVDYERQKWERGIRLWGGSTRARMRIKLNLNCEVLTRFEKSKHVLPNVVFRLRVLSSDLKYDKLVVTHIPGIGGDMAQILGDAVHACIKQLKPSLERKLLDKANAAIVKAADTKEVHLSLSKYVGGN
jgi:hypothetical protein